MRAAHRTFASGQNQYTPDQYKISIYGVIKKDYIEIIGQRLNVFVWCMFFAR